MTPGSFDPDFTPLTLLAIALANPVVIGVAYFMGRRCDQWQKLIVIGLAAALAGAAAIWIVTFLSLLAPRPLGSDAGLFVLSFLYAIAIAAIAYATSGPSKPS